MPNWNDVLREIQDSRRIDGLDFVRRKYLGQFAEKTGRNVIAYYSGWLQKPGIGNAEINDDDKNGFMAVIHGLDRKKGLDLILHTPGGNLTATESLVNYIHKMFGSDIRAVIPQIAMSAGTMVACACKEIIMGKHSNIGPVDPQFNGIPAHGVLAEFERAITETIKDPRTIPIWQAVIQKYHPTFIGECQNAIELASGMVSGWLKTVMFSDAADADIGKIVNYLNNHDDTKTHARHIHEEEARSIGLKIRSIENEFDDEFQNLLLTTHHAFMHTFGQSRAIKIIENHQENAVVAFVPESRK
ncbi:MAG: S49 family peptidase [Spirochaetales bacterium]|nr:S49 family peptidase [Spirochaetales bacterium]